jgi:hypothetical protein
MTATPTEKEKLQMTTSLSEKTAFAQPWRVARSRSPRKSPALRHAAPNKAKSAHAATPTKKGPKGRTKPQVAKSKVARDGSKTAMMLDLLKRPAGATSKELMKATGWLPHSVRGFLSGTVCKKNGIDCYLHKGDDGERTYSVEA